MKQQIEVLKAAHRKELNKEIIEFNLKLKLNAMPSSVEFNEILNKNARDAIQKVQAERDHYHLILVQLSANVQLDAQNQVCPLYKSWSENHMPPPQSHSNTELSAILNNLRSKQQTQKRKFENKLAYQTREFRLRQVEMQNRRELLNLKRQKAENAKQKIECDRLRSILLELNANQLNGIVKLMSPLFSSWASKLPNDVQSSSTQSQSQSNEQSANRLVDQNRPRGSNKKKQNRSDNKVCYIVFWF